MALRKRRAEVTLIEACRVDRGLTIEFVASQTGVSEKTITRYELALTTKPQGAALERLAAFYGLTASALLADMRRFARERDHGDDDAFPAMHDAFQKMPAPQMQEALERIAMSAIDPNANGNDTAEIVYAELAKLGILIP